MAGLVPAIFARTQRLRPDRSCVDGRDEPGHDGKGVLSRSFMQGGSAAAGRWQLAMTVNGLHPIAPGRPMGGAHTAHRSRVGHHARRPVLHVRKPPHVSEGPVVTAAHSPDNREADAFEPGKSG